MIDVSNAADPGRTAATALKEYDSLAGGHLALHDGPTPVSHSRFVSTSPRSTTAIDGFATHGNHLVLLHEEQLDPLLRRLLQGDFSSYDSEDLMDQLRDRLAIGDVKIAYQMAALVLAYETSDPSTLEAQCLAVEVLAAARVPQFSRLVFDTVRQGLESTNADLQFAVVAAISDLGRYQQNLLGPVVRQLVEASTHASVKSAAEALLRRIYEAAPAANE